MAQYYVVTLKDGITIQQHPSGMPEQLPEWNKTVFKSMRPAKRAFNALTKDEIDRIRQLRKNVRATHVRAAVPKKEVIPPLLAIMEGKNVQ